MRAREILLEFNIDKTIEHFGNKLYATMVQNGSTHDSWAQMKAAIYDSFMHKIYIERREEFKANEELMHAELRKYILRNLIDILKQYDPTNGKYSLWIVKLCCDFHSLPEYEDLGRIKDALVEFDTLKRSGYFARNKDQVQFSDINVFKTFRALERYLDKITDKQLLSNNQADKFKEQEFIKNDEVEIIADTAEYKVVIPKSEEASKYYGRNTRWCTAAKTGNMFDNYNEAGDLYIILDKKNNKRWQLHFDSMQFMDESDKPIRDWDIIPKGALASLEYNELNHRDLQQLIDGFLRRELPYYMLGMVLNKLKNDDRLPIIIAYLLLFTQLQLYENIIQYAEPFRKQYSTFNGVLTDYGNDILNFALRVQEDGISKDDLFNNDGIGEMASLLSMFTYGRNKHFIMTSDNQCYVVKGKAACYSPWGAQYSLIDMGEWYDGAVQAKVKNKEILYGYIINLMEKKK